MAPRLYFCLNRAPPVSRFVANMILQGITRALRRIDFAILFLMEGVRNHSHWWSLNFGGSRIIDQACKLTGITLFECGVELLGDFRCRQCKRNGGAWTKCVVSPVYEGKAIAYHACANCIFAGRASECSLRIAFQEQGGCDWDYNQTDEIVKRGGLLAVIEAARQAREAEHEIQRAAELRAREANRERQRERRRCQREQRREREREEREMRQREREEREREEREREEREREEREREEREREEREREEREREEREREEREKREREQERESGEEPARKRRQPEPRSARKTRLAVLVASPSKTTTPDSAKRRRTMGWSKGLLKSADTEALMAARQELWMFASKVDARISELVPDSDSEESPKIDDEESSLESEEILESESGSESGSELESDLDSKDEDFDL